MNFLMLTGIALLLLEVIYVAYKLWYKGGSDVEKLKKFTNSLVVAIEDKDFVKAEEIVAEIRKRFPEMKSLEACKETRRKIYYKFGPF